nr:HAD family phosphatase [Tissierella sp.]
MKAVVFDVDGTLVDSMGFWNNLARNYLLTLEIEAQDDLNSVLETLTVREGVLYIKEEYGIDKTLETIREEMDRMIFKFYSEEAGFKPYVLELLEILKTKGTKMAIATLTEEEFIESMLERLGAREYFEFIQTPTNSGIGKDSPDFYKLISERLNVLADETVFFEDSIYAMIPAKKYGMIVVGVEDQASLKDKDQIKDIADRFIKDFSEFTGGHYEKYSNCR